MLLCSEEAAITKSEGIHIKEYLQLLHVHQASINTVTIVHVELQDGGCASRSVDLHVDLARIYMLGNIPTSAR